MSKWEDKYNDINPKIDNMIQEQSNIINEARRLMASMGTNVSSPEYQEQKGKLKTATQEKKRLEGLKPNLKKVANIIEFRKQVEKRLQEYLKVSNTYKQVQENNKKISGKEKIIANRTTAIDNLKAQLAAGGLTDAQKKKINSDITKLTTEKQNAFNEKSKMIMENNALNNGLKDQKYGNLDKKDINAQIKKLTATIAKCGMACNNLMNGKKIEDIKFDKTKKYTYTPKKEEEIKSDEMEDVYSYTDPTQREPYVIPEDTEPKDINPTEGKSNFAKKHPTLAKIGNFFKKAKDLFSRKEEALPEPKKVSKPAPEIKPRPESKPKEVELTDKEMNKMMDSILSDDNKGLEDLATKGNSEFLKDIRVEMTEEGKKRLEQFRAKNNYRQGDTGPKKTSEGLKKALRGDSEGR